MDRERTFAGRKAPELSGTRDAPQRVRHLRPSACRRAIAYPFRWIDA